MTDHETPSQVRDELLAEPAGASDPRELPAALHGSVAAVVLVDHDTGSVTFANDHARELAPGVGLPAPIDEWAAAAGLHGPTGVALERSASPLSRIATGDPVHGEPVTVERPGTRRRMLWAIGFPLAGIPDLHDRALLAFLELSGVAEVLGDGADPLSLLRERAVVATDTSFAISDPHQPDNPLVWVNPAFTRVTGYTFDEVIGRNCRFLQGPDTDPEAVRTVREHLDACEPVNVTLLNYRKDGSAFWNELSLSPVFDAKGRLTNYVGVQADVTLRVRAERERERAYRAEQAARAEAEAAREKLSLLAEATTLLSATLDVDTALQRLAGLSVPALADWCVIDLVDPSGEEPGARRVAVSHVDAGRREHLEAVTSRTVSARHGPIGQLLADGQARLLPQLDADQLASLVQPEAGAGAVAGDVDGHAAMLVPLTARQTLLGVLTLVAADESRTFDRRDLALARDLASRAALAIDNARLYTREHQVAETLQRSLLPQVDPDALDGVELCARYQAAGRGVEVGGDWYDVLSLPDGSGALSIGDVMGHDLAAASAMGQVRSILRSQAWERTDPAAVLDRLDQLVQGLELTPVATAWFGRLECDGEGVLQLRFANAGHLPPLLREPDGTVRLLEGPESTLLGALDEPHRQAAVEPLPAGTLLLLYTDGLLERPGASLADGLAWLQGFVADLPVGTGCEALLEQLLEAVGGELVDDVALLAVRIGG